MTQAAIKNYARQLRKILNADYDHENPNVVRSERFEKTYRRMINDMGKTGGWKLVPNYSPSWCYVCGYIVDERGRFVYFSTPDFRYFGEEWKNNILIRTATSPEDHRGGFNHYTSLENFERDVQTLFESQYN